MLLPIELLSFTLLITVIRGQKKRITNVSSVHNHISVHDMSTTIHVQIYTCVDVYICTVGSGFLIELETIDLMDEQVVESFVQDVDHRLREHRFETM